MGVVADRRLLVLGAGPAQVGVLVAARRLGVVVVAADRDPSAPGFQYATRRAIVSVEDEPALERLARAEEVDGVAAPGSDRSLAIGARIAEKLDLPHPVPPETASAASSRQRERERLAAAGVPQPAAALCHSLGELEAAAERLGYPVTVAALDSQSQRGVAADRGELAAAQTVALAESRTDLCLVEPAFDGTRLVVAGYARRGSLRPLLVAEESAESLLWPAEKRTEEAIELAATAAAALGIETGPVWVRLACTPDGVLVERIAPRLGSSHEAELCRAAVGVDLNEAAVRAALDERVGDEALEPSPRVAAACVLFLRAEPGELRSVSGVPEAFALPGVAGVRLHRRAGHLFGEQRRPSDRAGAVLALGADRGDALARATAAAKLIRFETVDASALV
jgi:biotin carboxylase